MPNLDHLLTVEQAAELLHLSPRTVRHRIAAGKIRAIKPGGRRTSAWLISRNELIGATK